MKKKNIAFILLFSIFLSIFAPVGLAIAENTSPGEEYIEGEPTDEMFNEDVPEPALVTFSEVEEIEEPAAKPLEAEAEGAEEPPEEPAAKPLEAEAEGAEEPPEEPKLNDKKTEDDLVIEEKQDNYTTFGLGSRSVGDDNIFFDISPVNETVLSGNKALFKLVVKFTGSKRVHKDVKLTVDFSSLPERVNFVSDSLEDLKINEVEPTYDSDTEELTWFFNEIERGQTYEKIISLDTTNGYIANGTEVIVKASIDGETHFTENDKLEDPDGVAVAPFSYEEEAKVAVEATGSVSISKTIESPTSGFAHRKGEVIWRLEIAVPKEAAGQLFLDPDKEITVVDTLPTYITYGSMLEGGDPTISNSNKTLTWNFDVDSFTEQEKSEGTLYTKTLRIRTTVEDNSRANNQYHVNTANVTARFIGGVDVKESTSAKIYVAENQSSGGSLSGSVYVPFHNGPRGEKVTDDALLDFSFSIQGSYESRPNKGKAYDMGSKYVDFQEYVVHYDIDPNLIFQQIRMPKIFMFMPNTATSPVPFLNPPRFKVVGIVNGKEVTLVEEKDVELNEKVYTREMLGLDENDQLTKIKLDFSHAPAGLSSDWDFGLKFAIREGYTGRVENKFNVTGIDGKNYPFDLRQRYPVLYTIGSSSDVSGPRWANVAAYPPKADPVGEVSIELAKHQGGKVGTGANQIQVKLGAVNNSLAPMNEPLETVVLLPPGVRLNTETNASYSHYSGLTKITKDIGGSYSVTDNYNGSGRQIVKITWSDIHRITKGEHIIGELDVIIDQNAPSQLWFDVYGYSGDEGLRAPTYSTESYTNTLLQTDEDDLNADGNKTQPRLKSSNQYTLIDEHDLQTEKLIKGEEDTDYSKFTLVEPGGEVSYKLKLTNTTGKNISKMTLIDVLPSNGDLGITDNINRGSKFELSLTGPIVLPAEWENKVNVYYSKAKNPKRDDLTRNVAYPVDTPEGQKMQNPAGAEEPNWIPESATTGWSAADWASVHSFKVELVSNGVWIKGQDIAIDFRMVAPAEIPEDIKDCSVVPQQRAAWNSFAVSTDQGQVVEPERVGVALECGGSVELEKKDEEGNSLTGAEFSLYKKDEDSDTYELVKEALEVDADGKLNIGGLENGDYRLVETKAPEGYLLNNEPIDFTISGGDDVSVEKINYKAPGISKDVEGKQSHQVNRDITYNYNIKFTLPGDIKSYSSLEISDLLDKRLIFIPSQGTIENGWTVTGGMTKEQFNFSYEEAGDGLELKWSIKENEFINLIPGSEITINFKARIKPSAVLLPEEAGISNTAKLNFDNNYEGKPEDPIETPPVIVTPKEGGFELTKVDGDDWDMVLEGAEFMVTTDPYGKGIVEGYSGLTQVNGKDFAGLLMGLKTDENGKLKVEGLSPGIYYLHETSPPTYYDDNGELRYYKLLDEPAIVEINEDVMIEFEVSNKRSMWGLPQTGGGGTRAFVLTGFILLMLTTTYFYYQRRSVIRSK